MTASDLSGRLRSWLEQIAGTAALGATIGRSVAVGWATVELERAESELAAALGLPAGAFADVAPSAQLGARCRVAVAALPGDIDVALLEPSTEGRLAASLARHGEGPVAAWFEVASLAAAVEDLRRLGEATTVAHVGPFGTERLLVGGPTHGPYRLVVERPGTIRA